MGAVLFLLGPVRGDGQVVAAVVNSASYLSNQLSGGGIAPGSLVVIFGYGLGPDRLVAAEKFPLSTSLGGTTVRIRAGATTYDAIPVYASREQVAAVVPSRVPAGDAVVMVTYAGRTSQKTVRMAPSAFGIYSVTSNGVGAGVITTPSYAVPGFGSAVNPGEPLILWGTGLGAVTGDEAAGPLPGNRFPGTEVFVGDRPATVLYAGRSGCCAGLDQIVIEVPAGVEGCLVPVAVRTGREVSNFVTVPVAARGRRCGDALMPSDLVAGIEAGRPLTVGLIGLGPVAVLQATGFTFLRQLAGEFSRLLGVTVTEKELRKLATARGPARTRLVQEAVRRYGPVLRARKVSAHEVLRLVSSMTAGGAAAGFTQLRGVGGVAAQFGSLLPPPGACTVVRDHYLQANQWGAGSAPRDAGPQLGLTGPMGTHTLLRTGPGEYQARLEGSGTEFQLPYGSYTVTGQGGAQVGAFTATIAGGKQLEWTNKGSVTVVDRNAPLTVTWTGRKVDGFVLFGGGTTAAGTGLGFACVESAAKGQLTVPAHILQTMPVAANDKAYLFLGAHPLQTTFAAPGLDRGFFVDFSSDSRPAGFR